MSCALALTKAKGHLRGPWRRLLEGELDHGAVVVAFFFDFFHLDELFA